mgnify:CR=1 FL=1
MQQVSKKEIRVLHVVGGMNRGGVETWLMHVLRNIDRDQLQMDFLVHTTQPCAYDDELRSLGSKIIPCLYPSHPLRYAYNFRRVFNEYGPYDKVHSHVHHFSGYVLYLAKQVGVPVRIAHSHNDTSMVQTRAGWLRQGYLKLMRQLLERYATHGLAASRKAAAALFGSNWQSNPRWQLLYYGIDLLPFHMVLDRVTVRTELHIPTNALVLGHVGRFVEQKNHTFLIDIMAKVVRHKPDTHLLLVGDGPLRPAIEAKVAQVGLSRHVTFAGLRADVPRLMMGAMDVFVLPSLYEGLGLVLIEAQAAGLPCVFSDVVPEEVDIVKPLVQRLSLLQAPAEWSAAILALQKNSSSISQLTALQQIEQSRFNIWTSVHHLESIYHVNDTSAKLINSTEVLSSKND